MIIKQLTRSSGEQIFVVGQNAAGEVLSNGVQVCWDWRNAASQGTAMVKPATSNLGMFAGVLAFRAPSYADMPVNSFGLVQIYGVHGSVAYNVGAASCSCAGLALAPVNALYSGQSLQYGFGASNQIIAPRGAFLMTNDLSGSGWAAAFVRAL